MTSAPRARPRFTAASGPRLAARLAVVLWLAWLLACVAVVTRTSFTADLSAFLPRMPSAEQQLLVDQLREGLVSRLILVGIEGGDADGRAAVSRAMAARLRQDARFPAISNGEPVNQAADQRYLYNHRYLLSPTVTPERFTQQGLSAAVADTFDLLASPAGLFTKSLLPRDPTGEVMSIMAQLDAAQRVPLHAGAGSRAMESVPCCSRRRPPPAPTPTARPKRLKRSARRLPKQPVPGLTALR